MSPRARPLALALAALLLAALAPAALAGTQKWAGGKYVQVLWGSTKETGAGSRFRVWNLSDDGAVPYYW